MAYLHVPIKGKATPTKGKAEMHRSKERRKCGWPTEGKAHRDMPIKGKASPTEGKAECTDRRKGAIEGHWTTGRGQVPNTVRRGNAFKASVGHKIRCNYAYALLRLQPG